MKHTPEPWIAWRDPNGKTYVLAEGGKFWFPHQDRFEQEMGSINEFRSGRPRAKDADRIVACVNACAEVENPEKEIPLIIIENARLRQSLEIIANGAHTHRGCDPCDFECPVSEAKSALNKIKPEEKMSEVSNYCDAPNGPCLIVNERNATQLLTDRTKAHAALLNIYFVAKNKSGDELESVLSAIETLAHKALKSLSNIETMITEEEN